MIDVAVKPGDKTFKRPLACIAERHDLLLESRNKAGLICFLYLPGHHAALGVDVQ